MNEIISKELLSEVLGYKILSVKDLKDGRNNISFDHERINNMGLISDYNFINIHELAHKCKEWALRNNFCIISTTFTAEEDDIEENWKKGINYAWAELHNNDKLFRANTEPEAIFKSCQWILDKESK